MKTVIKLALTFVLLAASTGSAVAQEGVDRKLLATSYPPEHLKSVIIPRERWDPFPGFRDPSGVARVPEAVRQAYIREGEQLLDAEWKPLPATVFLEYVRTGNRSNYEALSFGRRQQLATLVLAEVFERKGRFLDQIADGVWAVCEESFWGVPAHLGLQEAGSGLPDVTEPVVDLFAAETGAMMAWIYYLLGPELDAINPLLSQRIAYETDRRILTPYFERDDWGWMGFTWRRRTGYMRPVNNWNPWINSNVLAAALILEADPERRLQLVYKVMESLDAFIEPYPSDGGCDEGPSYWNRAAASLFDALELLYLASDGKIDFFDEPLVRAAGRYITKVYIADPYFINFADASARMRVEPAVVYRYGKAIGDTTMMQFAAFTAQLEGYGSDVLPGNFGVLGRVLPALLTLEELSATTPREPLLRDAWLPDLQVMTARSKADSRAGFFLAAKGGHNDESHNHNDVGNFIVYHDGLPVLIDAGAQTYTAQTFSSRRYELWNNQSAYHNVPTINGVMQQAGRAYEARDVTYDADDRHARLSLDLAGAYPEEARVDAWIRTITLDRGQRVVLAEAYRLASFVAPFTLNFLTPLTPTPDGAGRIRLSDAEAAGTQTYYLRIDADRFEPTFETIRIEDERMSRSWGHTLHRIVLVSKQQRLADRFEIRVEAE